MRRVAGAQSNPFGDAKPNDAAARIREIDEREAKRKARCFSCGLSPPSSRALQAAGRVHQRAHDVTSLRRCSARRPCRHSKKIAKQRRRTRAQAEVAAKHAAELAEAKAAEARRPHGARPDSQPPTPTAGARAPNGDAASEEGSAAGSTPTAAGHERRGGGRGGARSGGRGGLRIHQRAPDDARRGGGGHGHEDAGTPPPPPTPPSATAAAPAGKDGAQRAEVSNMFSVLNVDDE